MTNLSPLQVQQAEIVADLLAKSKCTMVLTGAGISTESGLPDFRSKNGLWSKYDPMVEGHVDTFKQDPARIWTYYVDRFRDQNPLPNVGHETLAQWEQQGLVHAVLTQNVDGLHQTSGSSNVLELHGTIQNARCFSCKRVIPFVDAQEMRDNDEAGIPHCDCGGVFKPDLIMFGEMLNPDVLNASYAWAGRADLMLVLGTSLDVYPVNELPEFAATGGTKVVVINLGPTTYDDKAYMRVEAGLGDFLQEVGKFTQAN